MDQQEQLLHPHTNSVHGTAEGLASQSTPSQGLFGESHRADKSAQDLAENNGKSHQSKVFLLFHCDKLSQSVLFDSADWLIGPTVALESISSPDASLLSLPIADSEGFSHAQGCDLLESQGRFLLHCCQRECKHVITMCRTIT